MTTTYEKQIKMGIYWSSFIIVLLAWYSLFQSMWSLLEIDGIWGIIALAWGLIWFMWLVYTLFMKWKNDSDNLITRVAIHSAWVIESFLKWDELHENMTNSNRYLNLAMSIIPLAMVLGMYIYLVNLSLWIYNNGDVSIIDIIDLVFWILWTVMTLLWANYALNKFILSVDDDITPTEKVWKSIAGILSVIAIMVISFIFSNWLEEWFTNILPINIIENSINNSEDAQSNINDLLDSIR